MVSSRLMAGVAASNHLEVVGGNAVAVVLAKVLVLVDRMKDQLMMEAEKGKQFLKMLNLIHLLSSWYLIHPT